MVVSQIDQSIGDERSTEATDLDEPNDDTHAANDKVTHDTMKSHMQMENWHGNQHKHETNESSSANVHAHVPETIFKDDGRINVALNYQDINQQKQQPHATPRLTCFRAACVRLETCVASHLRLHFYLTRWTVRAKGSRAVLYLLWWAPVHLPAQLEALDQLAATVHRVR